MLNLDKRQSDHAKDPHYKEAKRKGYRARSAFKLIEIQKEFNIFKRAFYILDLGSAPGSWLQISKEFAIENLEKYNDNHYSRNCFKIMGVDIKKIAPIEDVEIITMDITNEALRYKINEFFKGEKLDLILSDASINKSGNKFSDQARQTRLCYTILSLSNFFLKNKGNFVIKTFQGEDFEEFYKEVKNRFIFLKSFKPKSSNKKSNEIYLIGLKKK
ncbi:MAG: SAM-dependent methyltransferase [Candidatus Hodarchaeota archaeon]